MRFSQKIKAGDTIVLIVRALQGTLRVELGINGKPATTLEYRLRRSDLAQRGPLFLALFAFGQPIPLTKLEVEQQFRGPRRPRERR